MVNLTAVLYDPDRSSNLLTVRDDRVDENELVLPEGDEIRNLSGEDLDAYETSALAEVDTMFQSDNVTGEHVERGTFLADNVERVRTERTRRAAEAKQNAESRDAILARVKGTQTTATDGTEAAATDTTALEGEVVPAAKKGGVTTALREIGGLAGPKRNLNPSLRGVKRTMTTSDVDLGRAQSLSKIGDAPERGMPVLVASADIPGYTQGGLIPDMNSLTRAMIARARTLGVTRNGSGNRVPVAQLQRHFTHNVDEKMSLDQMSQVLELVTDPATLVAAGGWCSPHEISYDFYNIVCSDGTFDLPTLGINRGGFQWPTSPSYADIAALNGVVWTWTNTMDIAAVTGTAQSGVKPCVRVPCPDYNDATLELDGMCVTVGNLTQDAFPELIQNHLRLVEAIHYHYMNTRLINAVVADSEAVTTIGTDVASSWGLLNSAAFERRDLIEKYQMCDDAIVEAAYPRFARDKMRADFAMRTGISDWQCVTDGMLADWFDCRNIRTQFIADWQVRASGQPGAATPPTNWATNTQYLIYPAGTWVRGQGMTLDLGVVRDSVLNETNDHTAAWMEEAWLVAKIGHESRVVTVDDCVNGISGAASASGCNV